VRRFLSIARDENVGLDDGIDVLIDLSGFRQTNIERSDKYTPLRSFDGVSYLAM